MVLKTSMRNERAIIGKEDPSKWLPWSQWTSCSTSCGDGAMLRTRACAVNVGCDGIDHEYSNCYNPPCTESKKFHDAKFMAIGVVVLINISMLCCIIIPYLKRKKISQIPLANQQIPSSNYMVRPPQEANPNDGILRIQQPSLQDRQSTNFQQTPPIQLNDDYISRPYVSTALENESQFYAQKKQGTESLNDESEIRIEIETVGKNVDHSQSPRMVHSDPNELSFQPKQSTAKQAKSSPAILNKMAAYSKDYNTQTHATSPTPLMTPTTPIVTSSNKSESPRFYSSSLSSSTRHTSPTSLSQEKEQSNLRIEELNKIQVSFQMGDSNNMTVPIIIPVGKSLQDRKTKESCADADADYFYRPSNIEPKNPYRFRPSINDNQHCNTAVYRIGILPEEGVIKAYRPSISEKEEIYYRPKTLGPSELEKLNKTYRPNLEEKVPVFAYRPPPIMEDSSKELYRPSINDAHNLVKPGEQSRQTPPSRWQAAILDPGSQVNGQMIDSFEVITDVHDSEVLKHYSSITLMPDIEDLKRRLVLLENKPNERMDYPSGQNDPDKPSDLLNRNVTANKGTSKNKNHDKRIKTNRYKRFNKKLFKLFPKHWNYRAKELNVIKEIKSDHSIQTNTTSTRPNNEDEGSIKEGKSFTLPPQFKSKPTPISRPKVKDPGKDLSQVSKILPIKRAETRFTAPRPQSIPKSMPTDSFKGKSTSVNLDQVSKTIPIKRADSVPRKRSINDSTTSKSSSLAVRQKQKIVSFAPSSQIKYIESSTSESIYLSSSSYTAVDNLDDSVQTDSGDMMIVAPGQITDRAQDDPTLAHYDESDDEEYADDDDANKDPNNGIVSNDAINDLNDDDFSDNTDISTNNNITEETGINVTNNHKSSPKKNLYNRLVQKLRHKNSNPVKLVSINKVTSSSNHSTEQECKIIQTASNPGKTADTEKQLQPKKDTKRIKFVGMFKKHMPFVKAKPKKSSSNCDSETSSLMDIISNDESPTTSNHFEHNRTYNTFACDYQNVSTNQPINTENNTGIISQTPNNKNNNRASTSATTSTTPASPPSSNPPQPLYHESFPSPHYNPQTNEEREIFFNQMTSPSTSQLTTPLSLQSTSLLITPDGRYYSDDNATKRTVGNRLVGVDNNHGTFGKNYDNDDDKKLIFQKIVASIHNANQPSVATSANSAIVQQKTDSVWKEAKRNRPIMRDNIVVGKIRLSEDEIEMIKSRRKYLEASSSSSSPSSSFSSLSISTPFSMPSSLMSKK